MLMGKDARHSLQVRNQIQRVTYGTRELTFTVKFGDSSRKYRWLDRY
jgi:hypothetical protein